MRSFVEAVCAQRVREIAAASIGPTTSEVARSAGMTVAVEADPSTLAALVQAIADAYGANEA